MITVTDDYFYWVIFSKWDFWNYSMTVFTISGFHCTSMKIEVKEHCLRIMKMHMFVGENILKDQNELFEHKMPQFKGFRAVSVQPLGLTYKLQYINKHLIETRIRPLDTLCCPRRHVSLNCGPWTSVMTAVISLEQ